SSAEPHLRAEHRWFETNASRCMPNGQGHCRPSRMSPASLTFLRWSNSLYSRYDLRRKNRRYAVEYRPYRLSVCAEGPPACRFPRQECYVDCIAAGSTVRAHSGSLAVVLAVSPYEL